MTTPFPDTTLLKQYILEEALKNGLTVHFNETTRDYIPTLEVTPSVLYPEKGSIKAYEGVVMKNIRCIFHDNSYDKSNHTLYILLGGPDPLRETNKAILKIFTPA